MEQELLHPSPNLKFLHVHHIFKIKFVLKFFLSSPRPTPAHPQASFKASICTSGPLPVGVHISLRVLYLFPFSLDTVNCRIAERSQCLLTVSLWRRSSVQRRSDRSRCVRNEKEAWWKRFRLCLLSHRCTPGQESLLEKWKWLWHCERIHHAAIMFSNRLSRWNYWRHIKRERLGKFTFFF